jgi:hypothetical protein
VASRAGLVGELLHEGRDRRHAVGQRAQALFRCSASIGNPRISRHRISIVRNAHPARRADRNPARLFGLLQLQHPRAYFGRRDCNGGPGEAKPRNEYAEGFTGHFNPFYSRKLRAAQQAAAKA